MEIKYELSQKLAKAISDKFFKESFDLRLSGDQRAYFFRFFGGAVEGLVYDVLNVEFKNIDFKVKVEKPVEEDKGVVVGLQVVVAEDEEAELKLFKDLKARGFVYLNSEEKKQYQLLKGKYEGRV